MAKSVKIGNHLHGSFKEGDEHCKAILDRSEIGQPIMDPKDHKYLLALIKGHNEVLVEHGVPTKIPAPICYFEKRWNRSIGWSTLGFWLKCINGFETDFSYKKAIRRKVDSPDLNFYKACREAIALDALEAKKESFKRHCNSDGEVQCEITGRWLKFEDAHLDHAGPFFFRIIVSMFRESMGWFDKFPEDLLTESGPGDFVVRFLDPQVRDGFRAIHQRHADLRLISKRANLAQASLARRPVIQRPVVIR